MMAVWQRPAVAGQSLQLALLQRRDSQRDDKTGSFAGSGGENPVLVITKVVPLLRRERAGAILEC